MWKRKNCRGEICESMKEIMWGEGLIKQSTEYKKTKGDIEVEW